MPTEQSYVGGDSHAKHAELTAQNTEPTVESTSQVAPDHTASELPPVADAPPTTPVRHQIVSGGEEPLLVPLTSYFSKVTSSRANVAAFGELLHSVFVHYVTSPEFVHRERVEGIDEISIIKSFYAGIATFIQRTADYRLGARPPQDPGPLPGEAERPDPVVDPTAYVSYGGDVLCVTDVATLQGWVTMLQTQSEVLTIRLSKEGEARQQEIEELRGKLELERDRLLIANRKIAELESRPAPIAVPPVPAPRSMDYSVLMRLDLGYLSKGTAEVSLVQYALQESYTATQVRGFNAIAEGEYFNSYSEFKDAETILGMLNELSESLTNVALNNLQVGVGSSPHKTSRDDDFEKFMTKYLPGISA